MRLMSIVLIAVAMAIPVAANAQKVDEIGFFGPGVSSSLANGTKSVCAIIGGKLFFHLGAGSWFSQLAYSASSVFPQAPKAKQYWSMRPMVSLGYRFRGGKSWLSLFGGFGESRNSVGDFLPTAVGGAIVKIKGRWGLVTDVSRNSQSWGASETLGYRIGH
jgi:hypothetical protein